MEKYNSRKLPETKEKIKEIIGLKSKALEKAGDIEELIKLFKAYNDGEKTIYALEAVITARYINDILHDENIQREVGNLLEEIRRLQK